MITIIKNTNLEEWNRAGFSCNSEGSYLVCKECDTKISASELNNKSAFGFHTDKSPNCSYLKNYTKKTFDDTSYISQRTSKDINEEQLAIEAVAPLIESNLLEKVLKYLKSNNINVTQDNLIDWSSRIEEGQFEFNEYDAQEERLPSTQDGQGARPRTLVSPGGDVSSSEDTASHSQNDENTNRGTLERPLTSEDQHWEDIYLPNETRQNGTDENEESTNDDVLLFSVPLDTISPPPPPPPPQAQGTQHNMSLFTLQPGSNTTRNAAQSVHQRRSRDDASDKESDLEGDEQEEEEEEIRDVTESDAESNAQLFQALTTTSQLPETLSKQKRKRRKQKPKKGAQSSKSEQSERAHRHDDIETDDATEDINDDAITHTGDVIHQSENTKLEHDYNHSEYKDSGYESTLGLSAYMTNSEHSHEEGSSDSENNHKDPAVENNSPIVKPKIKSATRDINLKSKKQIGGDENISKRTQRTNRRADPVFREYEKLFLQQRCNACWVNHAQMLNLPCRHLNSCESCNNSQEHCIKCGAEIVGVVKVYFT